jgi:hypothetical protein
MIHPQQKIDEVFMGLFTEEEFNSSSWESKRRGCLDDSIYFPVFVTIAELKAKKSKADPNYLLGSMSLHNHTLTEGDPRNELRWIRMGKRN